MLASLLPGLRDIRTPLTVGYLWLVIVWLVWADDLPRQRPPGDGAIARVFDLSHLLGTTATIAAVSFVAYVLGALFTIPTDSRIFTSLVDRIPALSTDFRITRIEYENYLRSGIEDYLGTLSSRQREILLDRLVDSRETFYDSTLWSEAQRAHERLLAGELRRTLTVRRSNRVGGAPSIADLRARLLVRNPEMYGEYDRFAAEAAFRVNLCLPLIVLGGLAGVQISWWWAVAGLLLALILAIQGLTRLGLSVTVLRRAILEKFIDHPMHTRLRELLGEEEATGKSPGGPKN